MSKAILLSVQSQHALNILDGRKTLELRKSVPKDFKGWVYVYVTKSKPYIEYADYDGEKCFYEEIRNVPEWNINGTIPFRFWYDEYDTVEYITDFDFEGYEDGLNHLLCLNDEQISNYGNCKDLYAWHIKKLEIFDKPMQLSDFRKIGRDKIMGKELRNVWGEVKRPPQSYQRVYVKE